MQEIMVTMSYKAAASAAAAPAVAPSSASASPVPLRSTSRTVQGRSVPVKPMGTAISAHSSHSQQHSSQHQGQHSQHSAHRLAAAQAVKQDRRDRVVLEHLPLVKAIAVRVHENLPVHVDLDDLVHAGILGLFDAASKYNPEKQVVFSSYAKHRIKGAILDSLRQLDWASRDMRRRHKQVEAATRDLASTLQRAPTESEVAEKLGMDVDRWRAMMLDLRNVGLISASTRSNEGDELPAPDFPSSPETQPDSICAREQLRAVLDVAMKTLPERYRKVVLLYYTNEMTMKEIGGVLGINESRVSQIHKSALEKMQTALQATGITSSQAF
jgi:RNA polymerase sigma factor for flagellar operon FliA